MNYQLPVNLSAILGPLSYGIVGINFLKQLDALGLKVCLFPIGIDQQTFNENPQLIQKCLANADEYNRRATSIVINQQFSLNTHAGKGLHVGFPIFELNRFTPRELTHLRNQDKLVVCSEWAKQILLDNNILNAGDIHVVPLGVDRSIFYPTEKDIQGHTPGRDHTYYGEQTRFINISKWEVRKGHYELLDYFESAFTPEDNVELWMVTGSLILEQRAPQEVKKWKDYYKSSPMADKIKIVDWVPSQNDVAKLLRQSDCYISLSKAEGFGLGALEAMSCGLNVIITDCTAHKQFANSENSVLLPVGDLELAVDNVFFDGRSSGQWYGLTEETKEVCVNYMRVTHNQKSRQKEMTNLMGIETAKQFSWEAAAEKLAKLI